MALTLDQQFNQLLETTKANHPALDYDLLKLAYDFAAEAHHGQLRASGEPYLTHSLATAQKLAEMKLDLPTIIAGLLHDVPEETNCSLADIKKDFGAEIAYLVEGITKLGKIKYRGMERYVENLRKMFVAMSRDIRVVFIKFADRLHNLQTLNALPPDKQLRIARESLEIYAPIAGRLGMGQIKGELEDLSFPFIYPTDYKWLMSIVPQQFKRKEKQLLKVRQRIVKALAEHQLTLQQITIQGRTKHLYSLYRKLLRPTVNRDITKIYDIVALRIIVSNIADCYRVLGVIHSLYRPLPGRIKDYIAQPKPNGYQSLHTTVFTDRGEVVEFQIRTQQMHQEAEFGIAAHWQYKEKTNSTTTKNIKWLQELLDWQTKIKDHEQFLQIVKFDVFQNRIFVLTPKGDVIDLPEESTPVDFAYHVHTLIGDTCVGARVNDQLVSLDTKLQSGDMIEIITDKNRRSPNLDWLESVKTSMAKNKIKAAHHRQKNNPFEKIKKLMR